MDISDSPALDDTTRLVDAAGAVLGQALAHGRELTEKGRRIDDHQAHCERLAYLATELAAARSLLAYARAQAAADPDPVVAHMAFAFAGGVTHRLRSAIDAQPAAFGNTDATPLMRADIRSLVSSALDDARMRAVGAEQISRRGVNDCWLPDELAMMSRESVRAFARSEVAPLAERIHRHDELVPDSIIGKMAEANQLEGYMWEVFVTDPTVWTAYLLPGLWGTLKAASISIVLAGIFGLVFGMGRLSTLAWVRWVSGVVVEFFRSVPVLLMMVFFYFGYFARSDLVSADTAPLAAVVLALTLYNGSVIAELVRSGVHSLPKGQSEAGLSIGLFIDQAALIPAEGRYFGDPCHFSDAGRQLFVENLVSALIEQLE